jgi:hypothetical protein
VIKELTFTRLALEFENLVKALPVRASLQVDGVATQVSLTYTADGLLLNDLPALPSPVFVPWIPGHSGSRKTARLPPPRAGEEPINDAGEAAYYWQYLVFDPRVLAIADARDTANARQRTGTLLVFLETALPDFYAAALKTWQSQAQVKEFFYDRLITYTWTPLGLAQLTVAQPRSGLTSVVMERPRQAFGISVAPAASEKGR